MNKFDFALILTCTINPVNIPNLVRNDPNMRFEDYKKSFNFWTNHPRINKIIFIENSNFDIDYFKKILQRIKINKLSFFLKVMTILKEFLIIHLTKISEKDLANIFVLRKFLKNRL